MSRAPSKQELREELRRRGLSEAGGRRRLRSRLLRHEREEAPEPDGGPETGDGGSAVTGDDGSAGTGDDGSPRAVTRGSAGTSPDRDRGASRAPRAVEDHGADDQTASASTGTRGGEPPADPAAGPDRAGGSGQESRAGGSAHEAGRSRMDEERDRSHGSGSAGHGDDRGAGGPSPGELARAAARQLGQLSRHRIEGIAGLSRDEQGWRVEVEVCEVSRVPSSTDVLGTYAVWVDDDGQLLGYERVERFVRGQASGGEG